MKDFIIGIRKVKAVPHRDVLSTLVEQRSVSSVGDRYEVKGRGDKHSHKCTKCHEKYSCTRGEGCSDVRSGVCDKCIKGVK